MRACVVPLRLAGASVSLMTTTSLTGGTACATGLTATTRGQVLNVTCPAAANAMYLLIQRPSASAVFLGMREVQVYTTSGATTAATGDAQACGPHGHAV